MAELPLSGRVAIVLGVEHPAGRRAAIALGEVGADVACVTLSEDTAAEFAANSAANEFWAMDRRGIVLTSDSGETTVREAIADATAELGPVRIFVYHALAPLPASVFEGLRSDPAIIVLVGRESNDEEARALLAWTRELADAGLRANAAVAPEHAAALPGVIDPQLIPEPLDLPAAVVYLASDASAAVEGRAVMAQL